MSIAGWSLLNSQTLCDIDILKEPKQNLQESTKILAMLTRSDMHVKKATSTRILAEVTWVKAALNLYLYMFSGHVFGALCDLRRNIKRELCLELIKKVPIFELLREQQLNAMCIQLKPVLYPGETYIVRKDDPVDEMLFIMRGELLSWGSNGRDRNLSEAEYLTEFCGEELSSWAIDPQSSSDQRPLSTSTIKTLTEVEAFALMADDLKDVFTKFKLRFRKRLLPIFRYRSLRWRRWAACIIQAAWRCYRQKKRQAASIIQATWNCYRRKKLEERMHEDEKKLQNALKLKLKLGAAAEGSSTSSVSGTVYATRFAAKALRAIRRSSKARMPMRVPTVFLQKPADPDFSDEDEE
ncbi:hypothetical protein Q3G72_001149 [Acer saccharum]|nr:hypothetical protein Q3G72_001149 [Acer saccharum]